MIERITDLTKNKKRKNLSKLKINLSKPVKKNLIKIAKYLAKDIKMETLEDIMKNFTFDNIKNINIEESCKPVLKILGSKKYKTEKENVKIQEFLITYKHMSEDREIKIYTASNCLISDSTLCYEYAISNNLFNNKIIDIKLLYGLFKMIDITYLYILNNKEFIFSKEFSKYNATKSDYSEIKDPKTDKHIEDISEYLLDFLIESRFTLSPLYENPQIIRFKSRIIANLILDVILLIQNEDYNIELMNKYNVSTNNECAKAFETKKNIPEKILKIMDNTSFLKEFSYVELDEDVDIVKFHKLEKEWNLIKKQIGFNSKVKPELRFKKLGKHRALGLYYPSLKCLCVDIKSPASFLHELGHFIDYTKEKYQLSLKTDFYEIANEYKKNFLQQVSLVEDSSEAQYLTRKMEYFLTPTEIFARCFEIYLFNNKLVTSFLREEKDFILLNGYPKFEDNFNEVLNKYYKNIVTINLSKKNRKIQPKYVAISSYEEKSGQFVFDLQL